MSTGKKLTERRCAPCKGDTPPLKGEALQTLFRQLQGWKLVEEHRLEKEVRFKNFKEALAFTTQVGALAEAEGHHPDIHLSWGKVRLILWTHAINGLSESDFILAAKCDALLKNK